MLMPSIFGESLFDDLFDNFARPANTVARYNDMTVNVMKTDIKENKDNFMIDIDLPGYNKDDVKISVEDGYLNVQATMDSSKEEKGNGKFVRRERYVGSCSRNFYVGDEVKSEEIKASLKNGILKLEIPKKDETKKLPEKKYISIEE